MTKLHISPYFDARSKTETTNQVSERAWEAATLSSSPSLGRPPGLRATCCCNRVDQGACILSFFGAASWCRLTNGIHIGFRSSGPENLRRVRRFYDLEVTTYA